MFETFLAIKPLLDSHFFVYETEPNNNETKHVGLNCLPCCLFWQNFNPDIKFLKWSGFILLGVEWQLAFIWLTKQISTQISIQFNSNRMIWWHCSSCYICEKHFASTKNYNIGITIHFNFQRSMRSLCL